MTVDNAEAAPRTLTELVSSVDVTALPAVSSRLQALLDGRANANVAQRTEKPRTLRPTRIDGDRREALLDGRGDLSKLTLADSSKAKRMTPMCTSTCLRVQSENAGANRQWPAHELHSM